MTNYSHPQKGEKFSAEYQKTGDGRAYTRFSKVDNICITATGEYGMPIACLCL